MKRFNLALQGGGSHGAYTWGVLDALLEDGRLEFPAISGTSAGAMNAVMLAEGLRLGGPPAAREKLKAFWDAISNEGDPAGALPGADAWVSLWKAMFVPASAVTAASDETSPYAANPFNVNPLRDTLKSLVDFPALRASQGPALFIGATKVRTGEGAVFTRGELTPDHVMASATLPHLFQAEIIAGEAYWDGGYSANPPLLPLIHAKTADDTILVQLNPIERASVPETADEIDNRINEITFNAGLLTELRWAQSLSRWHIIGGAGELNTLGAETKLDVSPALLTKLHDLGLQAAKAWLAAGAIGG